MITKKNFSKIVSFICASIIPLLVTGPFLPDLLLSISSIFFLYFCYTRRYYNFLFNKYFLVFLAFWATCILSSLLSEDIILSLDSSFFFIRICVFAILISYLIKQDESILKYFYFFFLLTFSILIIDGYYQYFNKYNLLGFPVGTHDRVSSLFGDELILGSYLVRLTPLFIGLFIIRENKSKIENYFFSLNLVLISVLIFLSGERAAMLFLFISSIFLLIFLSKYKKESFFIFLISFSIITSIIIKDSKLYSRYIENPVESMSLFDEKKSALVFFSPEHDSLIRTGWNMFLDKPILGQGPKMFRVKCRDPKIAIGSYSCNTHPHNFYIQLLAETGIIGFSFLAGLFIFFTYLIFKHTKKFLINKIIWLSDFKICLLAGLLITIWPVTTNGNFFTNHLIIIYSLQMGFFVKK